jgi:hypothetical protein
LLSLTLEPPELKVIGALPVYPASSNQTET